MSARDPDLRRPGPLAPVVGELRRVLRGRPAGLVPFDELNKHLRLTHMVDRGVIEVPLASIVGSVNRYRDFDRAFRPRDAYLEESLARMREAAETKGFPPVELYRVGDVHFVVDGHHRIAVARARRATRIEAHVREFPTDAPLAPDDAPEELLAKAAAHNFAQVTGLPTTGDGAIAVTAPAGYDRLLERIAVHRYYLGTMYGRAYGRDEAVASWRDTVYRPVVEVVRERGLLGGFPDRTEADLYLWLMERLHHLRERSGDPGLGPAAAVEEATRTRPWWRRWPGG